MKTLFVIALFCASLMLGAPAYAVETPVMPAILSCLKPTHPRLLASDSSWGEIQTRRQSDADLDAFLRHQAAEARALLAVEPVVYQKEGRRLLGVSRMVLRRVLLLAMQFRLSGDASFARRAQTEMLAAAQFKDWNPSHFLDTAEMTAALALGYDWLFDQLDAATRAVLSNAIREKGLRAGLEHGAWMKADTNWNSVCFAGMALGALAVAEDEPELAAHFLEAAKKFNPLALRAYAPVGVYPEGAMYWAYGTTFQVMLLSALESALGTSWELQNAPGFLRTADALRQSAGPTGQFFNYADNKESPALEGTTLWFAHRLKRPDLARLEAGYFQALSSKPVAPLSGRDRILPLAALWWPNSKVPATTELPLSWFGAGVNPIAVFRSRWNDADAMFLAVKGGRATLSHGHMDAGSFVFEADGVRWARDLGLQNYESLESKGIDLWNSRQEGGRWRVFRLNNFSHNTLTLNGQLHRADGEARITHFSDDENTGAIVDLSPVFAGQASRVTRGFSFRADRDVIIRDEIEGLKAGDDARFALLTDAQIEISADGSTATLTRKGQSLRVTLRSSVPTKWEIGSAQGPQTYDAPNPGAQMLLAHFTAPTWGKLDWSVTLVPGSAVATAPDALASTELKNWPLAPVK